MQDIFYPLSLEYPQIELNVSEPENVEKKNEIFNRLCYLLGPPDDSQWMRVLTEVNIMKNQNKKLTLKEKEIECEILNLQSQLQRKDEEINVLKDGSNQAIKGLYKFGTTESLN
ncbi:hypothetical protein AVEN_40954-1 [Araneus ventricosus]|uniref:Uncharacterized protein n=1 Tax=Araneus ventricosus TaxID=182803 RepID=A0A4Y2FEU2_ARAVE|nr:hypothetical protein AVEN_40954-1 [Araneus ventricosus]